MEQHTAILYTTLACNIVGLLMTGGVLLKHHSTWVRLKDQHSQMYKTYCEERDVPYQELVEK